MQEPEEQAGGGTCCLCALGKSIKWLWCMCGLVSKLLRRGHQSLGTKNLVKCFWPLLTERPPVEMEKHQWLEQPDSVPAQVHREPLWGSFLC